MYQRLRQRAATARPPGRTAGSPPNSRSRATAVAEQGVGNAFGNPQWKEALVYGDNAFTVPISHYTDYQKWELLMIATLSEEGTLEKAIVFRPIVREDSYYEYGFTPEGFVQHRITVTENSKPVWQVPATPTLYSELKGLSLLPGRSAVGDEQEKDEPEWDLGWLDGADVTAPYDWGDNTGDIGDPPLEKEKDPSSNWWDEPPGGSSDDSIGDKNNNNAREGNEDDREEENPYDPCEQVRAMRESQQLNDAVKGYTADAQINALENGHLTRIDGTPQQPSKRGLTFVEFIYSGTYTEAVHLHPARWGGAHIFSPGDINELYKMYKGGHIADVANFKNVVVAAYASGVLHISDPEAFEAFGLKYGLGSNNVEDLRALDNAFNDAVKPETSTPLEAELGFLQLLEGSGLSFSSGINVGNEILWYAKTLQDGTTVTINCP